MDGMVVILYLRVKEFMVIMMMSIHWVGLGGCSMGKLLIN
jgi:hypothetical protein